jgi:hypothetical protein
MALTVEQEQGYERLAEAHDLVAKECESLLRWSQEAAQDYIRVIEEARRRARRYRQLARRRDS